MRYLLLCSLLLGLVTPVAGQPGGYDFIRHNGKVVRHSPQSLPWRVYVNDHRYYKATLHALRTWNTEGHRLGLPDLFAPVDNLTDADMVMDWTGQGLPPDKAGGVWWSFTSDGVRISKFVMDPYHQVPEGNRAQILLQELGHALGLGDSSHRGDVMYPFMHTKRYRRVKDAALSARDKQAFRWLYSQSRYAPILSGRQSAPVVVTPPGQPTGTLKFDPITVELRSSVNVRVSVRNPQDETFRGPFELQLMGRPQGTQQWRLLKSWSGLQKIPAGHRLSRDYFSEMQPLFSGRFELRATVVHGGRTIAEILH